MPPEIIVILVLAGIMFVVVIVHFVKFAIAMYGEQEEFLKYTREEYAKALMNSNPNLTEKQAKRLARKKYPRSTWFDGGVSDTTWADRHGTETKRKNIKQEFNYERMHLINQGKYDEATSLESMGRIVDELLRK